MLSADLSPGFVRYAETNIVTTAASSVLANGKILSGTQVAALNILPVGDGKIAIVLPFGNGADNAVFTMHVWGFFTTYSMAGPGRKPLNGGLALYMGAAVCTLGTQVGLADQIIVVADRQADTVVYTKSGAATTRPGPATDAETAFNEGAAVAYDANTPNNDQGVLFLPVLMRQSGLILDFVVNDGGTNTATAANALVLIQDV